LYVGSVIRGIDYTRNRIYGEFTCTEIHLHDDSVTHGLVKWSGVTRGLSYMRVQLHEGSEAWDSVKEYLLDRYFF
jgi:hypothetical protein